VIGDALAHLPRIANYLEKPAHSLNIVMALERQFGRLLSKPRRLWTLLSIDLKSDGRGYDAKNVTNTRTMESLLM
jgi:hypothetical protein